MNDKKSRVIAFYLPQFHPIPENDEWWGKGFTEWTNVGKAKPLFRGHYQPKVPSDLGYYDLRVPEVREAQAQMARDAGIEGFCYWHYWFGNGKRLLERPFNEVLESGKPDFPFCLGWANHSWEKKTWIETQKNVMLIEQIYGGETDYTEHFNTMLPAFSDKRYMKYDNRLIFLVWQPFGIPDFARFKKTWNELAQQHGLNGFYFIGFTYVHKDEEKIYNLGFDAVCLDEFLKAMYERAMYKKVVRAFLNLLGCKKTRTILYDHYVDCFIKYFKNANANSIPCLLPNFDHTPRSGKNGNVLCKSTPEKFVGFINNIMQIQKEKTKQENTPLLFIKSWNEWGEGNYLEPDLEYGNAYLDALKNELT